MKTARLLTIGTEITCGEVVNTNAAWISTQLENLGVRVLAHLSVRDQRTEILDALKWTEGADFILITGGLGPTSDDITRDCVAEFFGCPLEFDEKVWKSLEELYSKRQLPLREAHRQQCQFPKGSERLPNPVGTALGFCFEHKDARYFVMPGPPRELEGMWKAEVAPRLARVVPKTSRSWHRWTFFAVPESEVAELVEKVIDGSDLEVGYRAQVPYVRVKLLADPVQHESILREMGNLLGPSQIPDGADLAEDILTLWPDSVLHVRDGVSEGVLGARLFQYRHLALQKGLTVARLQYSTGGVEERSSGLSLLMDGEGFTVGLVTREVQFSERRVLPYKIPLDSERGRRYAMETALWLAVRALKSPNKR